MKVPFIDLKAQHEQLQQEIEESVAAVMRSCAFAGGPFVSSFEADFATYCECADAVGVGSGTDALWIALSVSGIGPGDEVITTPNTFIATAEAITMTGARPVFVDIDEATYTMCPERLAEAITSRTRAVIPVHLYGQMCDMDPILEIARNKRLLVIEDACQAHGAEYKGKRAGSLGDAGCFSFYPGKNLGACGEAGAIVTNNRSLAERARMFRDHGQRAKYYHSIIGWNARMDGIQAAILQKKLKHLPSWIDARRRNASLYRRLLADIEDVVLPTEAAYGRHVYHIFAIRVEHRDEVIAQLQSNHIQCGIHYPVPIHLQDAYIDLGYRVGSFPVSEAVASQEISLPMFAELNTEQIDRVGTEIRNLFATTMA